MDNFERLEKSIEKRTKKFAENVALFERFLEQEKCRTDEEKQESEMKGGE